MQIEIRFAIAVGVALLVGAATWAMGWWAVIPIAIVAAWFLRDERGVIGSITVGAALGWALLLGIDAMGGRLGALTSALARPLGAPAAAVVFVTLAFPALLAWSAATLSAAVAAIVLRNERQSPP